MCYICGGYTGHGLATFLAISLIMVLSLFFNYFEVNYLLQLYMVVNIMVGFRNVMVTRALKTLETLIMCIKQTLKL